MRNPRPEAFDPKLVRRKPDEVDMTGVVPLVPKPQPMASLTVDINSNPPTKPAHTVSHSPTPIPVLGKQDDLMVQVRRAVRAFGKEAATHRFTEAEKQAIADIVYAYRGKNIRTSENEITRIAINYLICEYRQQGEQSILHQALIALNE